MHSMLKILKQRTLHVSNLTATAPFFDTQTIQVRESDTQTIQARESDTQTIQSRESDTQAIQNGASSKQTVYGRF